MYLTFSVTRLVWFDSCSRLESAFRPKRSSCGQHSARSAIGPKRWSAFRPVGIQAASPSHLHAKKNSHNTKHFVTHNINNEEYLTLDINKMMQIKLVGLCGLWIYQYRYRISASNYFYRVYSKNAHN